MSETSENINTEIEEIADLEELAKAGHDVPETQTYRIKVDKEKYDVDVPEMTVREILVLAGKEPVEQFALYQKPKGGKPVKLDINDTVDFRAPGIERFTTLPLDQREGEAQRKNFRMPEEDMEFLESLGYAYDLVALGEDRRVVIYGIEIPDGYNVKIADVHFRIMTGYPDQQIDMWYFTPALSRADGRGIRALSPLTFDGKTWQQWSRHRTPGNPWRPGIDNLSTHYNLTLEWLLLELNGGAS